MLTNFKKLLNSNNINVFKKNYSHLIKRYQINIENSTNFKFEHSEAKDEKKGKNIYDYDDNFYSPELLTKKSPFHGLNTTHGKKGVFDIDDLVQTLKHHSARNIVVCKIDKKINYVDYIAIVDCKSIKHMQGLAEFILKLYKQKRSDEKIPRVEGKDSPDWIAIDLGNIALHIFSKKSRAYYDIESLWAVGVEFDPECNKPLEENILELFPDQKLNQLA